MSIRNLYFKIFIILSIYLITPIKSTEESEQKSVLFICNKYTCPNNRGTCNELNECICKKGFDTVDDLSKGDFYCNYRRKSKLIAFLLEFVLGYGSGHFYMGNILLATIKMIYTSITCLLFCQHNSLKKITEYKRIAVPLERFAVLGWIIWQIVDGILIFFGFYNDGNGHELKGW